MCVLHIINRSDLISTLASPVRGLLDIKRSEEYLQGFNESKTELKRGRNDYEKLRQKANARKYRSDAETLRDLIKLNGCMAHRHTLAIVWKKGTR